jgi:hypothetical protein
VLTSRPTLCGSCLCVSKSTFLGMSLTCKCEPFTQVAQLVFFFLDEEDFKHLNLFVREAKLSPYKENI